MKIDIINKTQIALQCYDKAVLTARQVSEVAGINLITGERGEEWKKGGCKDVEFAQVLMQFYDKQLIDQAVLTKQLFNI